MNCFHLLLKKGRSFVLSTLILGISGLSLAQSDAFRVQSITLDENGDLAIEFPSADGSYYLLKRGATVDLTDQGVDGQIGADGTGILRDVVVGGNTQVFYVIQKISADDPLDMDEDGMDDLFELNFPAFLNPFNPDDAELDFDKDGSSNLKEYQDGTDPSRSAFNLAKVTQLTPASGEEMVNVTRNAVVHFDQEMDPDTITPDSFYIELNQAPIGGTVEVSSTRRFATFFPNSPLPTSSQVTGSGGWEPHNGCRRKPKRPRRKRYSRQCQPNPVSHAVRNPHSRHPCLGVRERLFFRRTTGRRHDLCKCLSGGFRHH